MLTINWNAPFKVRQGWRREWLISADLLSSFFVWWRKNKFKYLTEGFSVYKKDNKWYLTETKLTIAQFKKFSSEEPQQSVPVDDNFVLAPLPTKNAEGLRPWQVNSVGYLLAALSKWNAAIDGSDMGCHAKEMCNLLLQLLKALPMFSLPPHNLHLNKQLWHWDESF